MPAPNLDGSRSCCLGPRPMPRPSDDDRKREKCDEGGRE